VSYSKKRAALIAEQIERLATQNMHQLAGQFANLDFWISEAVEAIRILDGYPGRFRRLRDAQVGWVTTHGTKVSGYCAICGGACEFGPETPEAPRRTPSDELTEAREAVRLAGRRYFLRLYRAHLLDEDAVRRACDDIGVGVETEDFVRAPPPDVEDPAPSDLVPDRRRKQ
jgi:hypothetical protein